MSAKLSSDKSRNKIRVLPDQLANQIAAGEVVERPASVVKELIENAIDAGATRILIDIEKGGKNLIKVVDNGIGMSAEDARLAFSRHATSKIASAGDLEGILTLGFRGEALPSIASVAKVRLSTTSDETSGGTQAVFEDGAGGVFKDIACPRGTVIEVKQLFFNTPARRKFLKGDSTEFSHIAQVVTHQALAYPGIHFNLKHNGREIINTLPAEQFIFRIAELFGAELVKELVEVEQETADYKLTGYVSSPIYTRANRSAQYCFVNRRFVRDKVILHATQLGYSHLLPKGRHPVIFLDLTMDPKLLDVNVHPSKAEVRFALQQEVHQLVSEGVRNALSRNEKTAPVALETVAEEELVFGVDKASGTTQTQYPPVHSQPVPHRAITDDYFVPSGQDFSGALQTLYQPHGQATNVAETRGAPIHFDQKPTPVSSLIFSEFEPLGQLDNSFIILQGKRGIVVVDQHVAHERILYERFKNASKNKRIDVQQLLFPVPVEFSPAESELLTPHLARLKELGMEVELFGKNEFILRSVPAVLKNNDHAQILRETVGLLAGQQSPNVLEEKFEDILIMMSCRNAIKVNHPLGPDQITKLISDLEKTEMPFTCPHGRPIALFYDMEDLLKKFLRK